MICETCGKRIVHPDDWGDYDDAVDWACRCNHFKDCETSEEMDAKLKELAECGVQ